MRAVLVRGARQLLTLRGPSGPRRGEGLRSIGLIEDGSVLINDGIITSVGPTRRVENLGEARNAEVIDAHGRVVMPAFIDSHTHLISGGGQGADFERKLENPELRTPGSARHNSYNLMRDVRVTPARSLEFQASRILESCARHGTGTLEAKSGYGPDESTELKVLRCQRHLDGNPVRIVSTLFAGRAIPTEFAGPDEYASFIGERMIRKAAQRQLVSFIDVECVPGGLTGEHARGILTAAQRAGLPVRLHAAGEPGAATVRLGVEFQAASIDGLEEAGETDAAMLAHTPTIANLIPGSAFFGTKQRYAPARMLADAGAALGISSGFEQVFNPGMSMQMAISLACTQLKLTPAEAISGATINAAHSLRLGHRLGSIEYGKEADLIMLEVPDYRELAYFYGTNLVHTHIRRGETIWQVSGIRAAC